MNENELLKSIQEAIELFAKENMDKELLMVNKMVRFRAEHSTSQLQSLNDVYYFINGILFEKGLSDYWNGRLKKKVEK